VALLAGYSGIVQCDGYGAYKQLSDPAGTDSRVIRAFCWSHWRRKFVEIDRAGPAPIAHEVLKRIAALYTIESRIRGRSAEERRAVRQAETRPLVEKLKAWLETQLGAVSGKRDRRGDPLRVQSLGRLGAVPRRWPRRDGHQQRRASNPSDRTQSQKQPVRRPRRGSQLGLPRLADRNAKLHGFNPRGYLADILSKLVNGWPTAKIDDLLPWAWAEPNAARSAA
jgi:transposase